MLLEGDFTIFSFLCHKLLDGGNVPEKQTPIRKVEEHNCNHYSGLWALNIRSVSQDCTYKEEKCDASCFILFYVIFIFGGLSLARALEVAF